MHALEGYVQQCGEVLSDLQRFSGDNTQYKSLWDHLCGDNEDEEDPFRNALVESLAHALIEDPSAEGSKRRQWCYEVHLHELLRGHPDNTTERIMERVLGKTTGSSLGLLEGCGEEALKSIIVYQRDNFLTILSPKRTKATQQRLLCSQMVSVHMVLREFETQLKECLCNPSYFQGFPLSEYGEVPLERRWHIDALTLRISKVLPGVFSLKESLRIALQLTVEIN